MSDTPSPQPLFHVAEQQELVVDVQGPAEWIVGAAQSRSLHVYRLAPTDWLVSEVGRGNEGRGPSLEQALAALSPVTPHPPWWGVVAELLDGRGRDRAATPATARRRTAP